MTIIDAKLSFSQEKLKQFFDLTKQQPIKVFINNNLVLETSASQFIDDVIVSDKLEQYTDSKTQVIATNLTDATLLFVIQDYQWYHGHKIRINRLMKSDEEKKPEEVTTVVQPKPVSKKEQRTLQLKLEEQAMSEQRIIGISIGNDIKTIEAFKGDGWSCVNWLNKQIVLKHESLPMLKICLNLTTTSKLTDFIPLSKLIEDGVIVLC